MRRMLCSTLILSAALFLGGCKSNCKTACDNLQKICGDAFHAQGVTFDAAACADGCSNNLDGCKNMNEQEDCVSAATVCDQLEKCPSCSQ